MSSSVHLSDVFRCRVFALLGDLRPSQLRWVAARVVRDAMRPHSAQWVAVRVQLVLAIL